MRLLGAALVAAFLLSAPVQAQECAPLETVKEALNANGIAYDVLTPPRTARLVALLAEQLPGEGWGLAILALGPDGSLFALFGKDGSVCARINLTDPSKPEQADQIAKVLLKHVYGWKVAI
jgi:hypothetical protein